MRRMLVATVVALSSFGMQACGASSGGSRDDARTDSTAASSTTASSAATPPTTAPSPRPAAGVHGYLNDGDNDASSDDDPDDRETPKVDNDSDAPEDNLHPENGSYHDKDDDVAVYGPRAGPSVERTIAALVRRYYAVAASGNGVKACSMMYSIFAEGMAEDYGQPPGPPYLRGKTCGAVMDRMFEHSREQLASRYVVTEVRVRGNSGFVLLGSRTQPASAMIVRRERGIWKINSLLGEPLS